jgi:hypothetical protein
MHHRGSVAKVQKSEITACCLGIVASACVHVIQEHLTRALVCTLFAAPPQAVQPLAGRISRRFPGVSHTVVLAWSYGHSKLPRVSSLPAMSVSRHTPLGS